MRRHDGAARVRISVEAFTPISAVTPALPGFPLAQAREPLSAAQIAGCMAALGGDTFQATSRQGRPVLGTYLRGPGPAVFISGAQHANETSGCAAQALAASGRPLRADRRRESGRLRCSRLREQHPRHMLHASRYSALGDDIAYRERAPFFERDGRHQAHAISCTSTCTAIPRMNGHAPCRATCRAISSSGPFRRAFPGAAPPPRLGRRARRLIEGVTARLARNVPGLVEFNARQMELFRAHALETGFAVMNGIPVQVTETDREELPMALISEFPDETVYGDRYVFAHTVQMETVLAATDIYRSGL